MAIQTVSLPGFATNGTWEGAVLLDSALIAGGTTAYLRYVQRTGNSVRIRLAVNDSDDPESGGPDFTDSVEQYEAAFVFSRTGGAGIILKGPDHVDNLFVDETDPYFWTPDNGSEWAVWVASLSGDDVSLTITDEAIPPLVLADFDTVGIETDVLVLIESGAPPDVFGRSPRPVFGLLLDGDFTVDSSSEPVNSMRFRDSGSDAGGERISLHDNGTLHLGDYFRSGGDGNDLTVYVQVGVGVGNIISFPVDGNVDGGGSNFVIFNVPSAGQMLVAGIGVGDRFVFALARPLVAKSIQAAPSVAGAVSVAAVLSKEAAGVKLVQAAPSVAGAVSVSARLRSVPLGKALIEAAPSIVGVVSVSAQLSSDRPGVRLLRASPSVDSVVSVSAQLSSDRPGVKLLQASPNVDASLSVVTAAIQKRLLSLKQLVATAAFSGSMSARVWARKGVDVPLVIRPFREQGTVPDVVDYADLLISQYRSAERLKAFIRGQLGILQTDIVRPMYDLEYERNVDFAVGVWLDYIGVRLGFSRPNRLLSGVRFFGFGMGADRGTFGEVPFFSRRAELEGLTPIDDVWYWSLLRGRALSLRLGTSVLDLEDICAVTFAGGGYVIEGNRSCVVYVKDNREGFVDVAIASGVIPKPAGVSMEIISV